MNVEVKVNIKFIKFTEIPKIIDLAMKNHEWSDSPNLSKLRDLDAWTKDFVKNFD